MGKGWRKRNQSTATPAVGPRIVPSLLEAIQDGNEYGSIVSVTMADGSDITAELKRGLREIEVVRGRPCIAYIGNVVRRDNGESGIDGSDDLPFHEMVASVPTDCRHVDVFLSTRGGSAHQVNRFVNALRARFDSVDFLIPSFSMSAGTLFALSGDRIWMTDRACLGPIDPQVPTKEGRYVPAQALLTLVQGLQDQGQAALAAGKPVPWTAIRIIDSLDKKDLADAITASQYSTLMAAEFLERHKFKDWAVRQTSQIPVTTEYRRQRSKEVAAALASHDRWKNHGHAISREVLWQEIKLQIDHPTPDLQRAMIRCWSLFHWVFDKTPALKIMLSQNYTFVRHEQRIGARNG